VTQENTLLQTVLPEVDLPAEPPKRFTPTTMSVCEHCGDERLHSEGLWLVYSSYGNPAKEGFYCDSECAEEDGWITCESCEDWLPDSESQEFGYYHYCSDCWNENFFTCERCGCDEDKDEMNWTPDAEEYCNDCFREYYNCCDECNEFHHRDESVNLGGLILCEHCFSENHYSCDDCGEAVHCDDVCMSNDSCYCECCYQENQENHEDDDEGAIGDNYSTLNPTYNCVGRRRFGVELEYTECTNHANRPYFRDIYEHTGREYVSGIMYSDGGLEAVRDFAEYAKREGWTCATSGNRCGYHLHIDMRDLSVDQLKSIASAYIKTRGIWEACVAPWRKDGHRFSKFEYHDIETIRNCRDCADFRRLERDRFKFINWQAYSVHGTLEIRGHEGTLEPDEICNWIVAHTRFVDHVSNLDIDAVCNMFTGAHWKDFATVRRIIGDDVAKFYTAKARKHGKRMTLLADHTPFTG